MGIVTCVLLLGVLPVRAAPPELPADFYGTARLAGMAIPAGALLSAQINGVEYGSCVVLEHTEWGTVYHLTVVADDPDTPSIIEGGREGDPVVFVLQMPGQRPYRALQVGTWHGATVNRLDLLFPAVVTLPLVVRGR